MNAIMNAILSYVVVSLFIRVVLSETAKLDVKVNGTFVRCKSEEGTEEEEEEAPSDLLHTVENCHRKIRLTLTVHNSEKTPDGDEFILLEDIYDSETKSRLRLLNPITIKLRQEQVLLAYPFHYLTAVNGNASEVVVNYENLKNFTGCDDTSPVHSTCGLKHQQGKAIPFSQGFCCKCTEATGKHVRGGQDCSQATAPNDDIDLEKYKASAHCLHLSKVWYTVNALEQPIIEHTVFVQVYNRRELLNGSTTWVDLTEGEEFTIGTQTPFQFDENKTIVITYVTDRPGNGTITIPFAEKRLLVPQPTPGADVADLHEAVKSGAGDYILLSKEKINSGGDECNKAGVSYEAFSFQENRCKMKKGTCLQNQPLDFWTEDEAKKKSGGKGTHLLRSFGTPFKDPILVNETTREHWLALEYYKKHASNIYVELNADKIIAVRSGKYAQIASVVTVSADTYIELYITIVNGGLVSSEFAVQVVECSYNIPDSKKQSAVIAPQLKEEYVISMKYGTSEATDRYTCTVEASSKQNGVVAMRKVSLKPKRRCICYLHCKCNCLWGSLECEPLEEKLYHLAGFRGSLPILTAKPPYKNWIQKHPILATLAFFLLLLLLGCVKAGLGFIGYNVIEDMGLYPCLYRAIKIPRYYDADLNGVDVIYDDEGYPVNPDTKEHAKVIGRKRQLLLNTFYFYIWPCILIQDRVDKHKKEKAMSQSGEEDKDSDPIQDSIVMETLKEGRAQVEKGDINSRINRQGDIQKTTSLEGKMPRRASKQTARGQPQDSVIGGLGATSQGQSDESAIPQSQSGVGAIPQSQSVESAMTQGKSDTNAIPKTQSEQAVAGPVSGLAGPGKPRVKKPPEEEIPQLPQSIAKFQGATKLLTKII